MIQIVHHVPGRFGDPVLEVRMTRGVSAYPLAFKVLLIGFAVLCLAVAGAFAWNGALPVLGFAGLELILLFALLRIAFRNASSEEGVKIAGDATVVERAGPNGRRVAARLESYWLRVEPARDNAQGLVLRSRGTEVSVGVGLPANEVRDLARAVGEALRRVKAPPIVH